MTISAVLALLIAVTTMFGATTSGTFHWSGNLPAGKSIEIRGINGSIHAEPAVGDNVDVIAYKSGSEFDPAEINVQVMEHDGGVTICAVYPGRDGHSGDCGAPGDKTDIQVDFTVHVPPGVRFVGRTVNGLVEAHALRSDTEAHTVNGNLRLSTLCSARGDTVNGSIEASVGRITSAMKFTTVNGAITLEMPARSSARVRANTLNGHILTNFPLAVRHKDVGQSTDASIGTGGPELRIDTVNGSINLKKRITRL